MSVPVPPLGPLLGAVCGPPGAVLEAFGPSRDFLGPSWCVLGCLLGRLGPVREASWAVSGSGKLEKATMQKSLKKPKENRSFSLSGPS